MSIAEEVSAVRDYYDVFPQPAPEEPPREDWEAAYREKNDLESDDPIPDPPEPPDIPGPPTPGAGMQAARAGDSTAHGGTIGPVTTGVTARVNIGGKPAACMDDPHVCPMFSGAKAHAGGTITKGSLTVNIGGKPAARVSDLTVCSSEPGAIAAGERTVLIGDLAGTGSGSAFGSASPAVAQDEELEAAADGSDNGPAAAQEEYEPPAPAQPGDSVVSVGTGTHWIEVELLDEANRPVVAEDYLVTLPDGQEVPGNLDAEGQVRIEGIEKPGSCRITFPNLDWAAWGRRYTLAQPDRSESSKRP